MTSPKRSRPKKSRRWATASRRCTHGSAKASPKLPLLKLQKWLI